MPFWDSIEGGGDGTGMNGVLSLSLIWQICADPKQKGSGGRSHGSSEHTNVGGPVWGEPHQAEERPVCSFSGSKQVL